jgi:predicted RNase H-like HicB family nuclease
MDREKILKARFCFYRYEQYEARSPFLPYTFGVGDTAEEAMKDFEERLDETIAEWEPDGGLPEVERRPREMGLRPETERLLYTIRDEYQCSLDEALDILAARYDYMVLPEKPTVSGSK